MKAEIVIGLSLEAVKNALEAWLNENVMQEDCAVTSISVHEHERTGGRFWEYQATILMDSMKAKLIIDNGTLHEILVWLLRGLNLGAGMTVELVKSVAYFKQTPALAAVAGESAVFVTLDVSGGRGEE